MRLKRLFMALLSVGLLTSHITAEADSTNPESTDPEGAAVHECYARLHQIPEVLALERKIPLSIEAASDLDILSNRKKPSAKEKRQLAIMVNEWEKCNDSANLWRSKSAPRSITDVYAAYWVDTKSLLADLYSGNRTYGDVTKMRIAMEREYSSKIELAAQTYRAQLQAIEAQDHEAEVARQKQVAQDRYLEAMQAAQIEAQQQQRIEADRREAQRRSNAQRELGMQLLQMGQAKPMAPMMNNSTSCQTRFINGVAYTDCR